MYTWNYIKEAALSKLDLGLEEAEQQNLLARFATYANEVITQVCSSIKPKYTFFVVNVTKDDFVNGTCIKVMPSDFISFGDDVNTITEITDRGEKVTREAYDTDLLYNGYNEVCLLKVGTYRISYNARWIDDFNDIEDALPLSVPKDILDCIPSYIASQCYKIDDEYKSSVFRNEYEMFLARIDDTNYKNTKTFKIGGDW